MKPSKIKVSSGFIRYHSRHAPLAKLDQLNLDLSAKTEVNALIQALIEQAERDTKLIQAKDTAIQAKDVKIAALTHELAYYKCIRFSTKSEAWALLQRDVFEETWKTDISAIEADVEQLHDDSPCETAARPKRPAPVVSRCPRISPGSNIATNRNPAPAGIEPRADQYRRRLHGCRR